MKKGLLIALFLIIGFEAKACPQGYQIYSGDCIEENLIPDTQLKQMEYYGNTVVQIGKEADLFAPDTSLLEKADLNSKKIYNFEKPSVNVEATAKIEKVLDNFYFVTVNIYDGSTSCGNKAKIEKTLKGYIAKTNKDDLPSLWKYRHIVGLC